MHYYKGGIRFMKQDSLHVNDILFERIKNDDMAAYETLFKSEYRRLSAYASTIIGKSYAEEVVQDVMLSVWENRKSIIVQSSVTQYLYGAVRYRCLDYIKRNEIVRRAHQSIFEHQSSFIDEVDIVHTFELSAKISDAMNKLPTECKEAFELSRFNDLSYKEIAVKMKTTIKSVDYKIQKALTILRKELKHYK